MDGSALPALVSKYHPALVIADVHPTPWVLSQIEAWKMLTPSLRVMLLRVWRSGNPTQENPIHKSVDYVLYKPFDVDVVSEIISDIAGETSRGAVLE
jgi:hypothetical protein